MAGEHAFELTEASPSQASARAMPPEDAEEPRFADPHLHRRTLLKLDCLLLPFLALLFLFNALDKANVCLAGACSACYHKFDPDQELYRLAMQNLPTSQATSV